MIYITGDTHGERARIAQLDQSLKEGDILIVCGDWGYIFKNDYHEKNFLDDIECRPWTMAFVDGNHENFPAIYSFPEEVWNGGKVHRIRKNIVHLCRGQVFDIEGTTFFTFGGGYSIDKALRRGGYSSWQEELPNDYEYREGKANLALCDNRVDYIITHTANIKTIEYMASLDRYGEIKRADHHEAELDYYLEDIRETTDYKGWFFGHFHREYDIPFTRQRALWFDLVCLDKSDGN